MIAEERALRKIIREHVDRVMLDEGLIKSWSTDQMRGILHRKYENSFSYLYNLKMAWDENGINFDVNDFNIEDMPELLQLINNSGFYPALIYTINLNGQTEDNKFSENKLEELIQNKEKFRKIEITIEKKFDKKHPYPLRYLYHATETENLEKIFSRGLMPKSYAKKAEHPDRIYFTTSIADAKLAINTIKGYSKKKDAAFCILKIDAKKIGYIIELFTDPNFTRGLYTYDSINPAAITAVENI